MVNSFGFPDNTDVSDTFNMRRFIEALLEREGAEITGGGTGFGQSDFDFVLDGQSYNVSIKPI